MRLPAFTAGGQRRAAFGTPFFLQRAPARARLDGQAHAIWRSCWFTLQPIPRHVGWWERGLGQILSARCVPRVSSLSSAAPGVVVQAMETKSGRFVWSATTQPHYWARDALGAIRRALLVGGSRPSTTIFLAAACSCRHGLSRFVLPLAAVHVCFGRVCNFGTMRDSDESDPGHCTTRPAAQRKRGTGQPRTL